jgi:phosphomannomutase
MSRKYFGTDGVRGCVGEAPITPDFCLRLGYAAGKTLVAREHLRPGDRPAVIIGKDTRISGYMLESALEAGFAAAGVDVFLAGPLPTPAIAYLTRALRLQAGVVISASHNPFEDNGIKFSRRQVPSCLIPSSSRSKHGSMSRWGASRLRASARLSASMTRAGVMSNSARTPSRMSSTCVA